MEEQIDKQVVPEDKNGASPELPLYAKAFLKDVPTADGGGASDLVEVLTPTAQVSHHVLFFLSLLFKFICCMCTTRKICHLLLFRGNRLE